MPEGECKLVSEAKETLSEGVRFLGVVEIIFGAILVYSLWLCFATPLKGVFLSTGHEWIDGALLVGAAAAAGRVVTLLAALLMAVTGAIMPGRHRELLSTCVHAAVGKTTMVAVKETAVIDMAEVLIVKQSSILWQFARRANDLAIVAHSFCVVLIIIGCLPVGRTNCKVFWTVWILAVVCVVLGALHQRDYRRQLALILVALDIQEAAIDE